MTIKRIVDIESLGFVDQDSADRQLVIKINIGILKVMFRLNDRLRLQLIGMLTGNGKAVHLPVDDFFCQRFKTNGRWVDLTMDDLGVRKVDYYWLDEKKESK